MVHCTNVTLQFGSIPLTPKSKKRPDAKAGENHGEIDGENHVVNESATANEGHNEGDPPNPDAEVSVADWLSNILFMHTSTSLVRHFPNQFIHTHCIKAAS